MIAAPKVIALRAPAPAALRRQARVCAVVQVHPTPCEVQRRNPRFGASAIGRGDRIGAALANAGARGHTTALVVGCPWRTGRFGTGCFSGVSATGTGVTAGGGVRVVRFTFGLVRVAGPPSSEIPPRVWSPSHGELQPAYTPSRGTAPGSGPPRFRQPPPDPASELDGRRSPLSH